MCQRIIYIQSVYIATMYHPSQCTIHQNVPSITINILNNIKNHGEKYKSTLLSYHPTKNKTKARNHDNVESFSCYIVAHFGNAVCRCLFSWYVILYYVFKYYQTHTPAIKKHLCIYVYTNQVM